MRRLLACAGAAALVALGAACGNGNDEDAPPEQAAGSTEQVCMQAQAVQLEQEQLLSQELAALEQQDLDEQELAEEAVEINQQAITRWSDGLAEQAQAAEDPELATALSDLSDGLADLVPQLTVEALQTGQIPGIEEVDARGQTVAEICQPAMPDAPADPGAPGAPGE